MANFCLISIIAMDLVCTYKVQKLHLEAALFVDAKYII